MNIEKSIENLIAYAKRNLGLHPWDENFTRNTLFDVLAVVREGNETPDEEFVSGLAIPDAILEGIGAYALEKGLCEEDTLPLFLTKVMGVVTPMPSVVVEKFEKIYRESGPQAACDYLYDLSIKNNYIQKSSVDKNIKWTAPFDDRYLEITINLSKPEKSNKDIAKLLSVKASGYPACALCAENMGFAGSLKQAARQTSRTIPVTLNDEPWFMQYSPYVYYDEHCIVINEKHIPMNVDESTFTKLSDFVTRFPNYFLGSNASLPIIGGSILNHEHFQGGRHILPMQKAKGARFFKSGIFTDVKIEILDWFNSVIRISSTNLKQLRIAGCHIYNMWENFSLPELDIIARSDRQHNGISPVARKDGDTYIFDIFLRNNRTDERYPDGIFHAHPEFHNIKSEGIGLIEAMGLFILPGRLKRQSEEIEKFLTGEVKFDEKEVEKTDLKIHIPMIKRLFDLYGENLPKEIAKNAITTHINFVCMKILGNTAVFKENEAGKLGFGMFMDVCGFTEVEKY